MANGKNRHKSLPVLSERFRNAYFAIPYSLRGEFRKRFCKANKVVDGTLRQKINGAYSVSEKEVNWVINYDPYAPANQPEEVIA